MSAVEVVREVSVTHRRSASAGVVDRPSVYDLIGEWCNRLSSVDDAIIAARVEKEISDADWRVVVDPLIVRAVADHRRSRVRTLEQNAFTGRRNAPDGRGVAVPDYEPDIQALRKLLSKSFIPERGSDPVTWGQATDEQHAQRAAALLKLAGEVTATARRHEDARKVIAERGVSRLDDVFGDDHVV